ncbi:glutamate 5-kinase [Aureibacillus halotolerans]|uniref:Glutamate 5-kinase n=1 Tax=Aureibacillus halotolerans TaxID=1508390 RepID=A0A4R6U781_9BACI|nr:glutamate 5-kinase [Aureibacillus halotolerans]TDQ42191.1 glutamate 5-kinase [Aureibacillus halotolerans]
MRKKTIVVKIGSSSLTNATGALDVAKLHDHTTAIGMLRRAGHQIVLISSGAVAAGYSLLGYPSRPVTVQGKQAAASIGQVELMRHYSEAFQHENITVSQLLLTRENFSHSQQYRNAHQTLQELLKRGVLPIINENDSVAIDELTFGDNDMLSALVSGLVHAQMTILLTDINGLYDCPPHLFPEAKKYQFLPAVTDELLKAAGKSSSNVGTGGMRSKVEAAKAAMAFGSQVFIGSGSGAEKLLDIIEGKGDGTYIGFQGNSQATTKKQWIAVHSVPKGTLIVDEGAAEAILSKGRSLLRAGVLQMSGAFSAGDVVDVRNPSGQLIARGIASMHSQQEVVQEKSNASDTTAPLIHRNNLVTIQQGEMIHE